MYDSFDMACHDEDNALRLNIKVNSENLLPTQQKYNLGSLRLPADPSWPKIPQRRLSDDVGDIIQPECNVASNGTPLRSRTVARTPQSQSCRLGVTKDSGSVHLHHCCQKAQTPQCQLPKRRSGGNDPRFKKVMTVKSQMTSTDSDERKVDKQPEINSMGNPVSKGCKSIEDETPLWKDMNRAQVIQQKAEKPDETKGTESVGIQTVQTISPVIESDRIRSMTKGCAESNKQNSEPAELGGKICSPVASAGRHSKSETPRLSARQEKKTAINLETDSSFKNNHSSPETVPRTELIQISLDSTPEINNECISYENVPVQISLDQSSIDVPKHLDLPISNFELGSIFKDIEIPKLDLPNDAMDQFLNFGNMKRKTLPNQKVENLDFQSKLDSVVTPRRETKCKHVSDQSKLKENYSKPDFKSSPEKVMKNIHNEEKCRPERNAANIFQDASPKHNFHIYYHQDNKPFQSCCANYVSENQEVLTDSESERHRNMMNQYRYSNNREKQLARDWDLDPKYKTLLINEQGRVNYLRQKRKMKSEQHLMLNKKRVQSSEPQISNSRRQSKAPYLKKANSYLSKYTQKLIPDLESGYAHKYNQQRISENENKIVSEGNGISANTQDAMKANFSNLIDCEERSKCVIPHPADSNDVKREHCIKPYERPSNKSAKISSSLDFVRQNYSQKSPRAETDVTNEKPTAIPVKTQQLLNKSYWEYYNKLKLDRMENGESAQQQYFCQVAMGAPKSKKRRAPELIVEESNDTSQTSEQVELSLPEIRTLEQCSVLSTMINKTLDSTLKPSSETIRTKQIYINGNMRSSSDPTAGTQSAILKKLFPGDNEGSIVSSTPMYKQKHKRDRHSNNKTLKLKTIGEHPVVFFGCMVYALIVFLPMIYDYFSYEEHDEYEDLSYVEIAFEYVLASFKEAFGEFFDMINKIFFKPRSCRKCNNLT